MLGACCALLAAAGLAGCKGESKSDGDDGSGGTGGSGTTMQATPVAAANFGQTFAEAYCAIGACCEREGYAFTLSSCQATVKAYMDSAVNTLLQIQGVAFDETKAAGCAAAYRALVQGCTDAALDQAAQTACDHLFHGTVPEGGACSGDQACADIAGAPSVQCNAGVCARGDVSFAPPTEHAKLGESCSESCEDLSDSSRSCEHFGGSGSPPANAGGCFRADGLYCTQNYVCAPFPKVGEPCPDYECATDSYCDGKVCVASVTTGPCPHPHECFHTSYCDYTTQTCMPLKTNGTACNYDAECISSYCAGDVCRDWSVATARACSGLFAE